MQIVHDLPEYITHYNEAIQRLQKALDEAGTLIQWQVLEFEDHLTAYLRGADDTPEGHEAMRDMVTIVSRLQLGGDWLRGRGLFSFNLLSDGDMETAADCIFRSTMETIEYAIKHPGEIK